ncbi:MAG: hypothetical protein M3406_00300 [Chloroflexota bacterium]|nr:hypothetical protein [Chloroflexota bacterium]
MRNDGTGILRVVGRWELVESDVDDDGAAGYLGNNLGPIAFGESLPNGFIRWMSSHVATGGIGEFGGVRVILTLTPWERSIVYEPTGAGP